MWSICKISLASIERMFRTLCLNLDDPASLATLGMRVRVPPRLVGGGCGQGSS
jgi:hypothetical protein